MAVRIAALAFCCLSFATVSVEGKPISPVDVELLGPEVSFGTPFVSMLRFRPLVEAARVEIAVAAEGALTTAGFQRTLGGPWAVGETYETEIAMRAAEVGTGRLKAWVRGFDGSGQEVFARAAILFVVSEREGAFTSPVSLTDARSRRLEYLSAVGAVSPAQRESMLERLVTARARVDHEPREPAQLDPYQRRTARVFAGSVGEDGTEPESRITAAPSPAAVGFTVQGRAEWTDRNGNLHPISLAEVEIYDDDLVGSDLIAVTRTDMAGDYSAAVSHDDGVLQGNPDIFVRVLARSPVADVQPQSLGSTYNLESGVEQEVAAGATVVLNLTAGNVEDAETAFSVHHALVFIGGYAGTLAGTAPSQIDVKFPSSGSFFNGTELHLFQADRWDWDVIHHEYGHYFMNVHGFVDSPGGNHGSSQNLASLYGKDAGIRLAWGEGWPTFFGTSGQIAAGGAGLGVPNVGDTVYSDTEDLMIDNDQEAETGTGEDNELSVSTALFDLYDNSSDGDDLISLGDRVLFEAFRNAGPVNLGEAWDALAEPRGTRERVLLGAVFGQSNVAPVPTAPPDNAAVSDSSPPTFRWRRNGGGTPNPLNDFRLRFYSSDFQQLIFEKELGDTDEYTPAPAELTAILAAGLPVHWVVEGRNTSAPETPGGTVGRYWSGPRTLGGVEFVLVIDDTGSMSEEIDGVRNSLQRFIDTVETSLGPDEEPPVIELLTFKDSVTVRIVSNDLDAVRVEVAALTASGGGDCPEFSVQALEVASHDVAPGGTILLATDASSQPGVDRSAVLSRLRAKGVAVNTILSGDCLGEFAAPSPLQAEPVEAAGGAFVRRGRAGKPDGGDDPSQDPIPDPGEEPFDEHGDDAATATLLPLNRQSVRGALGPPNGDIDVFRLDLEAGETVALDLQLEEAPSSVLAELVSPTGDVLASMLLFDTTPQQLVHEPTASGAILLRLSGGLDDHTIPYVVSARPDALSAFDGALELFSTISRETGGVFLVRDGVNFGDATPFESAIYNSLLSSIAPAVIAADPARLPAGATLAVTLQGRNTNWRPDSEISFSGTGVQTLSITSTTATSLTALVRVDPSAALDFRDIEVATPLGGATETAVGSQVVELTPPVTTPTLLSIEPSTVVRGREAELVLRGILTAWDSGSTVDLGQGISVLAVTPLSATELKVDAAVDDDATIGFRTASVATPPGGPVTRARAVLVAAEVGMVPELVALVPEEGAPGQALGVGVTGRNTNFQDGVTTASFGPGIDVLQLDVMDATSAVVTIEILPDAAVGFRNVTLTTGAETAVALNGFFVGEEEVVLEEIPTLGEWALVLLGTLLASLGLLALRRG